jgi:cholesterol oxidase
MPSATRNLFEKRFLDFQKLLIKMVLNILFSFYPFFFKLTLYFVQKYDIKSICTNQRRMKMPETFDYDFIVIGSGFGGSVSALRLSEKGYNVGVLEMGKCFKPEKFPKTNWRIRNYLWMPKLSLYGIQQLTLLKNLLVFHGAGVGGGSLNYANTLLVPPDEVFTTRQWPGNHDWKAILKPHYHMAKFMLGVTEAKETYHADELLRRVVDEETGRGDTFTKHQVGVFWGDPDQQVEDPYFNGEGPARKGCKECGECISGCKYDAKNTLDKNYLHLAKNRGCVIHPENLVIDVQPLTGGGYEIHTVRSTARFRKRPHVFRCRGVVFSAGVLGTLKLLLQCKKRGSLPDISDQLGNYVRTNSEAIVGVTAKNLKEDYSKGIAITSGVFPDSKTHVEAVRYGKGHNLMSLLATYLTGSKKPWPRWLRWLGGIFRHPVGYLHTLVKWRWASRTILLLFMQTESNYMRLKLSKRLWGQALTSQLEEGQKVPTGLPLANKIAEKLAKKIKGVPQSILLEVLFNTSSTAHILGGAIMGTARDEGVCDEFGRVFGYQNMYIADGSIVPANLGVNPALTITAISEYVMSGIHINPEGTPKPVPGPK